MFVYFDENGTLKEIISDKKFRVGDSKRDKIYIYWAGEHYPLSGWIKYQKSNGAEVPISVEEMFFDSQDGDELVGKSLPLNPPRNLKYFDYEHTYEDETGVHTGYLFYEITLPDEILSNEEEEEIPTENNMVVARVRFTNDDDEIETLGAIVFSVETNIGILTDSSINTTQYNYLIKKLSEKLGIKSHSLLVEELPEIGVEDTYYVIHNDPNDPNKENIYIWNGTNYIWIGDNSLLGLENYYTKEEIDNFENQIVAYVSAISSNAFVNVDTTTYPTLNDFLNSTGTSGKIYLYPQNTSDLSQGYYQYIWYNNAWVSLGTTDIDLSDYFTKAQTQELLWSVPIQPTFTDGIFIYYSNGNTGSEGGYSSTDFLSIVGSFKYRITCRVTSSVVGVAFYDENQTYISGQSLQTSLTGVETFVITAPATAKYMRFTTLKSYKSYSYCEVINILDGLKTNLGSIITSTDLEQKEGNSTTKVMSQKAVSDIFDFSSVSQVPVNTETFATTITDGKYCNPANGNISDVSSYKIAEIDLTNVSNIFNSYSNRELLNYDSIVFFDGSNTFISGYQPVLESQGEQVEYNGHYGVYFTIPANAKKAIINLIKNRDSLRYSLVFPSLKIIKLPNYHFGSPLKGKKVVNFGDSIFGNYRDTNNTYDKSISKMIEEMTGATTYNAGFGGCRMSNGYQYWDAFSMDNISDSIYANDWSEQEQALIDGSGDLPSYFADTVNMLKQIDFSKIDYITIGYGTNDYSGNIDLTTFGNALKHSIEKILSKYPKIRIVVISPCWRWWASGGVYSYSSDDAQSENTHGDKLIDYVDKCKEVCEQYHIAFVDTYITLGFNQYTATTYFDGTDGTHPNQAGRQLRAERIVAQINSLFN